MNLEELIRIEELLQSGYGLGYSGHEDCRVKEKESLEIESEVDKFLRGGGRITQCEAGAITGSGAVLSQKQKDNALEYAKFIEAVKKANARKSKSSKSEKSKRLKTEKGIA